MTIIDHIYIEKEVFHLPKTREILNRFPKADRTECDRYTEVFNLSRQNFRLQKQRPSLILAKKHAGFVLPTPPGYGIGTPRNYYFSPTLNCPFDCRYCFLQGMYRSAHYVIFVNFEDFTDAVEKEISDRSEPATFFSGYDADSLALEGTGGFIEHVLPFFRDRPETFLEIRTKSNYLKPFRNTPPLPNVVIAYSLNPEEIIREVEHRTPRLSTRLRHLSLLQKAGWPIGLRFDPLIYHPDWKRSYESLFDQTFTLLDPRNIHSVTLGPFRLPNNMYKKMVSLYPEDPLFFRYLDRDDYMTTLRSEIREEMVSFCSRKILSRLPKERFFPSLF